jgi:hypothetical protein
MQRGRLEPATNGLYMHHTSKWAARAKERLSATAVKFGLGAGGRRLAIAGVVAAMIGPLRPRRPLLERPW